MPTLRLVVFTEQYAAKAKPKQAEYDDPFREKDVAEEEIRVCFTCGKRFAKGDVVVIKRNKFGPHRRHVTCAVQKNLLTREEARDLLEQAFEDMRFQIPDALMKMARESVKID